MAWGVAVMSKDLNKFERYLRERSKVEVRDMVGLSAGQVRSILLERDVFSMWKVELILYKCFICMSR